MNIDLSNMRKCWWEDEQGNILDIDSKRVPTNEEIEEYPFYHSCFPCQIHHSVSYYGYHPKGIYKLLIKLPFLKNYVEKKIGKTFRDIVTFNTTYKGGSDCIVAMVNSGDYTLEEAIWVFTTACERCMNVLCFKYLDGKEGYPECSDEWVKCNTICDFCEDEK
jgi:hypothetical protein